MVHHRNIRQPRAIALWRAGTLKSKPRGAPTAQRPRLVWKQIHGQRVLVKVYPAVWHPEP